jgi:hypothetical protein
MIFPRPIIDGDTLIDFYAGNDRSYKRLLPLWNELEKYGRQGTFFASRQVHSNGISVKIIRKDRLDGFSPLVIASYKDLNDVFVIGEERPFIMYETEHNTETRGLLDTVSLFLCHDERTLSYRRAISDEVIKVENEKDAADKLLSFCKGSEVKYITEIDGHSVGIIYMAFGEKAGKAIIKSQATLRRLGYKYPVFIIGDKDADIDGLKYSQFMEYKGDSPYDITKAKNFKFRAGRIKPHICLASPFEFNLYLDADTQFISPVHSAFEMLHDYDIMVTEEKLSLADLYNKKFAGWELNLEERDVTMIEIGDITGKRKFINSGVMFFRRNKRTIKLFSDWSKEWQRFQEWDEQLALIRALHNHPEIKINQLPVEWNYPHYRDDIYIYHHYGRGDVRINPS